VIEYRAYTVGRDGHLNGFEPFVCFSDDEAIEKAKQLAVRHDVELWNLDRLVTRIKRLD